VRKRRGSEDERVSTDDDSDTDYSVDYECDSTSVPLLSDDSLRPASSEQRNGVCSENNGPVDGLANDVKGPCFW